MIKRHDGINIKLKKIDKKNSHKLNGHYNYKYIININFILFDNLTTMPFNFLFKYNFSIKSYIVFIFHLCFVFCLVF